jgi:hypothetical protein
MSAEITVSINSIGITIATGTVNSITAGAGLTGGTITQAGTIAADFAPNGGGTATQLVGATDLRLSNARTPSGAAAGDLSGSYPSPSVTRLAGTAVDTSGPSIADVWQFNGTQWIHVPQNTLSTNAVLFATQPIDQNPPSVGDVWQWTGVKWDHVPVSSVATDATLVNYTASGSGVVTRTVANRLNDVISVKNFGAVGDGNADDTAAIDAALTAAMGKTLFFPAGTYVMKATGTRQILKTLTGPLEIIGQEATIVCDPTSGHVAQMIYLIPNSMTLKVSGLSFDANQKALTCLQVEDSVTQGDHSVYIERCAFRNTFGIVGGVAGVTTNCGAWFGGGFKYVSITNTVSENHSRALNASIPFTSSTLGIFIANSATRYPENVYVAGCLIANITNSNTDVSNFNIDVDGLSIFGGLSNGSTYVPSRAIVVNNTFVNCKGRSVKIQNDETTLSNNTVRFAIKPCGTTSNGALQTFGGILDVQGSAGVITGNVFHYDLAPGGQNPFSVLNTPPALNEGGYCFGSYYSANNIGMRPRSLIFTDNVIYNNVPEAVGHLRQIVQTAEQTAALMTGANAQPAFITIRNNRMLGGAVQDFAFVGLRDGAVSNGKMYMTVSENYASKMQRSLMVAGSVGTFDSNHFVCVGNVNASGTAVAHLIDSTAAAPLYPTNITAIANVNIGLAASQEGATGLSFIPRLGGCAPMQEGYAGMSIQTVTLASGASHTFPRRYVNTEGATFLIVSNNIGGTANAMFTLQGATGGTLITNWANSAADIAASGGPPSVAGTLGIGRDVATANEPIRIKNNFTGSRSFTLFTFG